MGRCGSERPARLRRMALETARDCVVLSDDPVVEVLLQPDQLLDLALHQARHRDPGPAAHHLGDVLLGDLLGEHPHLGLKLAEARLLRRPGSRSSSRSRP